MALVLWDKWTLKQISSPERKMFFTIGSSEFSCQMFLEVKAEDDLQECREILNEILEEYKKIQNSIKNFLINNRT